jgi:hypothetical protein
MKVGEESLTDLNLLELVLDSRAHVRVQKFNKPEEGRCGADWEWWFSDGRRWIGCRVQAKVIDLDTAKYEELHYKNPTKTKHQCDLLIERATKSSPRRLPLYALYSNWERKTVTPVFKCCVNPSAHTVYGCAITSAWQVRKWRKSRRGRAVSKLIDGLQPWRSVRIRLLGPHPVLRSHKVSDAAIDSPILTCTCHSRR